MKIMKDRSKYSLLTLLLGAALLTGCNDDRALYQSPESFSVNVSEYSALINDTVIVNVNQPLTFKFPNGCTDQILYYSGELGNEYRFAKRTRYSATDGTTFDSRLTLSTGFNLYDGTVPTEDSLFAVSGADKKSQDEFLKANKIGLKLLRSGSSVATTIKDQYIFTATSTPVNLFTGDINIAIRAKSADATKNMLSILAATDTLVKNTEIRDYGYTRNGVTVVRRKTVIYPVISNILSAGAWAQYAPDSTKAPASLSRVANAKGYTWNMGELGVNYAPAVTGDTIRYNQNKVPLATSYPVSVVAPKLSNLIVPAATSPSECWLVSRSYNPCAVLPDVCAVVKRVDQSSISYFQYVYKETGVYTASFVGYNVGTNGTVNVVRKFTIIVQ